MKGVVDSEALIDDTEADRSDWPAVSHGTGYSTPAEVADAVGGLVDD